MPILFKIIYHKSFIAYFQPLPTTIDASPVSQSIQEGCRATRGLQFNFYSIFHWIQKVPGELISILVHSSIPGNSSIQELNQFRSGISILTWKFSGKEHTYLEIQWKGTYLLGNSVGRNTFLASSHY